MAWPWRGCSSTRSTTSQGSAIRWWCRRTAGRRPPTSSASARWGNYTQVLAAKGYCVLQPNYRGSTGYGDAFLRDMVGPLLRQRPPRRDDRRRRADRAGPGGRRPHGQDGLERRRPHDEQDHHVHRPLQGGRPRAPAPRTGFRCTRRATCGPTARRGSAARRGRRTRRSTPTGNNSPLKDVVEGEDADDLPGR